MNEFTRTLTEMERDRLAVKEAKRASRAKHVESGANLAGRTYGAVSRTVRATTDFLGIDGTIGGLAGYLIGGPLYALAGVVIGKNADRIYKAAAEGLENHDETKRLSHEYEKINTSRDARFTPQPYATVPGQPVRNTLRDWVGSPVKEFFDRRRHDVTNAGKYHELEAVAEAVKARTGKTITPKDAYTLLAKQRNEERDKKTWDRSVSTLLEMEAKRNLHAGPLTPADAKKEMDARKRLIQLGPKLGKLGYTVPKPRLRLVS